MHITERIVDNITGRTRKIKKIQCTKCLEWVDINKYSEHFDNCKTKAWGLGGMGTLDWEGITWSAHQKSLGTYIQERL